MPSSAWNNPALSAWPAARVIIVAPVWIEPNRLPMRNCATNRTVNAALHTGMRDEPVGAGDTRDALG